MSQTSPLQSAAVGDSIERGERHSIARRESRVFRHLALIGLVLAMILPHLACSDAERVEAAKPEPTAPAAETRPGEDWPKFLGPHENGVSDETDLLTEWPKSGPPVLWQKRIGTGYSAPSVRGNRLVAHHRLRDEEVVECLRADTGEPLWRYGYESNFSDPYGYNNGPRCSPLLTDDRCHTYGAEGKLLCLELATGKKIWERDTQKDWAVPRNFFGVGSTPILEGDRLIALVGGLPSSGVVAFDAQTGETLWESVGKETWEGVETGWPGVGKYHWPENTEEKLVSYSSPIAVTIHGQRHVLCLMRHGLVSLDPRDGRINFKYWFRSRDHESVNAARPVVVDDLVFLSAAYKTGAALLRVHADGKGYDEVWRDPRGMSTHWSTAIHQDGYLYGFSGRHEQEAALQCIDLKTGELQWETNGYPGDGSDLEQDPGTGEIKDRKTNAVVPWPFYGRGSAIVADGKFLILAERGTLALTEINPRKFHEFARTAYARISYPSWAAPVLSRQRLYLRDEDALLCLNLAPAKE